MREFRSRLSSWRIFRSRDARGVASRFGVARDAAEDAVHEAGELGHLALLGEKDCFAAGGGGGHAVHVEDLVDAHAQNTADHGPELHPGIFQMLGDDRIQLELPLDRSLSEALDEGPPRRRQICSAIQRFSHKNMAEGPVSLIIHNDPQDFRALIWRAGSCGSINSILSWHYLFPGTDNCLPPLSLSSVRCGRSSG